MFRHFSSLTSLKITPTKAGVRWTVLFLFLVAVVSSLLIADLKVRALAFHWRDYPLYLQFAAKLFDPHLSDSFSLNPAGGNWLLFYGTEGVDSFHQAVHFEPVKYLFAVLYASFREPLILFSFVAFLYFLPPVYLALIHPLETTADRWLVVLAATVYFVYPPAIFVPTHDIRPFVLLAPLFVLSILAVVHRRPFWEILLLFNLQFLVREEALLLSLAVIVFAWSGPGTNSLARKLVLALTMSWLVWAAVILTFFLWTGYPNRLLAFGRVTGVVLFICLLSLEIGGVLLVTRWLRSRVTHSVGAVVLLVGALFGAARMQSLKDQAPLPPVKDISNMVTVLKEAERFVPPVGEILSSLFVGVCLVVGAVVVGKSSTGKPAIQALLVLLGIFVFADFVFPPALPARIAGYERDTENSADVLGFRESTNKYTSWILCDDETYQAFCDYEHVYVYSRLPWSLVSGNERFYPENLHDVETLLKQHIEYIVVSLGSMSDIDDMLTRTQCTTTLAKQNARFAILQIHRAGK